MVRIRVIDMEGDGDELNKVLERLGAITSNGGGSDPLALPPAPDAPVPEMAPTTMAPEEEPPASAAPAPKARTRRSRSPTSRSPKSSTNTCKTCGYSYASKEHRENCPGRRGTRAASPSTEDTI